MPTNYPAGLTSYGVPVMGGGIPTTTGKYIFLHSGTGSSTNHGESVDYPVGTLSVALDRCTAEKGDIIVAMPGHSETITTAANFSKIGVSLYGLGFGRNRPTFTASGAIDLINVSSHSHLFFNCRFLGAAASVTALMNIASTDVWVQRCSFFPGGTPTETVTVASGANRFFFEDCRFTGTANGPDSCFFFEIGSSSISEWVVRNCVFNFASDGLDRAVFVATADAAPGGLIEGCNAIGLDSMFIDFESSVDVCEGIVRNCFAAFNAAITAANVYDLGGYAMQNVAVADGANRGAVLHPATSAT